MKLICAWRNPPRIMGEKEPLDDNSITDGICDRCLDYYFPTMADKAEQFGITEKDRYPEYELKESKRGNYGGKQ